MGRIVFVGLLVALGGCYKLALVEQRVVRLPAGRSAGPIEVAIPRRADRAGRDLEVRLALRSRCGPRFQVEFPDGERESIGAEGAAWQALLRRRAEAAAPEPAPPGEPAQSPPPVGWRLERRTTDSWPGQQEFLATRAARCAESAEYRLRHIVGYERRDGITLHAEVPQELADAELEVSIFEIVEPAPRPVEKPPSRAPSDEERAAVADAPPRPPPDRRERPGRPEAEGATWQPGHWQWEPGGARWRWIGGYWRQPAAAPAPRAETPGAPPIVGAIWIPGEWAWESERGRWRWVDGGWGKPPPPVEERGAPPAPGTPWIGGEWRVRDGALVWQRGCWGLPPKPPPRDETPPAPPLPGARFIRGDWLLHGGRWEWIPGYYEQGGVPPPPPRVETPPPRPSPDAVWLAGFWRWGATGYAWVGGHWELPPGEGYVWVPDPASARGAAGGRWELRVRVTVPAPVRLR